MSLHVFAINIRDYVSYGSSFSSRRAICISSDSIPSRRDSKERDISPSCELGSSLRDIALCRSRRDSFMWSASRKSCDGLLIVATCSQAHGRAKSWCLAAIQRTQRYVREKKCATILLETFCRRVQLKDRGRDDDADNDGGDIFSMGEAWRLEIEGSTHPNC